jgi:predicted small lipoprotein YifL
MRKQRNAIVGAGTLLACALISALPACGQKGPLYVPGYPKEAAWPLPAKPPVPVPAPPPAPGVPASSDPAEKK